MKLVCGITTKNEEWIIGKTLSVLTKFCDKIIILDDNSNDETRKICSSFKNIEWNVRKPRENIWQRNEAEGLNECFNLAAKHNPEYILMLDADEIPTPAFINFFNNIDKNINAWSVRMINLHKDEFNYRTDNFITSTGIKVNNDPFKDNGWRKTVLIKYDKNYNYTYNLTVQKGGTSKFHPMPQNLLNPIKNTEDFYIIHYGKLNEKYTNGEKDIFYAKIEEKDNKGSYEERLKHHYLCRTGSGLYGPIYKKCPDNWFWN